MAFLNGIFGGGQKPATPQPMPGQQQPGNGQQPQNNQQPAPQVNNNGSGGGAQNQMGQPANSQVDGNSLDPFARLMTPSKEVLDQKAAKAKNSGSLFGDAFTPENVDKVVGSMDFTRSVDPAKVQAALGGDQAAFMEVLNAVTRASVSASLQASSGMVEKGVSTGTERFGSDLDSRMRDFSLRGQTPENPALKHPVGKAMFSGVSKQIADANPHMSAEEVAQNASKLFDDFTNEYMKPKTEQQQAEKVKGETNWSSFLDPVN